MKRWLTRLVLLSLVLSAVVTPGAEAGTASISIDSVGDRRIKDGEVKGRLGGKVLVQGTAVPGGAAPTQPAARPLVADAGDSAFVASGSPATLLGMGFGGAEPYTFAWTTSAGTLASPASPTTQVDTTGLAPGTYTASLTVTDSAGATARDDVKFVVFSTKTVTLLDESRLDPTPGVLSVGVPGVHEFPFTVPQYTLRMEIRLTWTVDVNDYDLRVNDPRGNQVASSGGPPPGTSENTAVTNPTAGTWTALVDKFLTAADTVRVVVSATVAAQPDPRPVVTSGGPYRFATGTAQTIAGTVTGGTAPLAVGWDTNNDGRQEVSGASFTGQFADGRHIITIKATDANGLERRETTSVSVAPLDRLSAMTTALTVVAINDSGINPYHSEFSAETYPDPDVLRLTNNFTRHPSEYIAGFPKDAPAIRMTTGQGYFPAADAKLWSLKDAANPNGLEFGRLYWIPGTKIVGAFQPGPLSCSNCAAGAHVILDDDGHGTGSSSVSVGNRYGYCPTCLLVAVKGLGSGLTASSGMPWVDIQSNSWGTLANLPLDYALHLAGVDPARPSRIAVERGQTVLVASGNGAANAFDTPSPVYGTSTAGPDWNIVVGAIRRDVERPIVGDGTPAHLSSWGDGNLPSACRTGTVSQCMFGGTSAATPYTAGVFGHVLTAIRQRIGDPTVGQRPGQVIAEGFAIPGSPYLADGKLTRAELREAVLKTAFPLNQDNTQTIPIFPYPLTAPYNGDINVLFEGYGAATPNSAKRAIDVLMGRMPLPIRAAEDRFFALDRQIRDSLWGGYDRNGDGVKESEAAVGQFGIVEADIASAEATWATMRKVALATAPALTATTGANALTYFLHRAYSNEPNTTPSCASNVTFMDQTNSTGDFEPCFESRITTVLAAYRPVGIWPSTTDLTVPLPAGSRVDVDLYLTVETPTAVRPTANLMATDRVLGTAAAQPMPVTASGPGGALCATLGDACWTRFRWSFTTTRHAIAGEQITFQIQLLGTRSWAFGYEGRHASSITITPAAIPADLAFGVTITEPGEGATVPRGGSQAQGFATFPALGSTAAGDHPTTRRVEVSVDDPTFANPIRATLTLNAEGTGGSWEAPIPALASGPHTLYVRAAIDRTYSPVAERRFTVESESAPLVQWQIVRAGSSPAADKWRPANGVLTYDFEFRTADYGSGDFVIHTRLLEGGVVTAATSLKASFR